MTQGWKLPITRACLLVLQDTGHPIHYRDITKQLVKRGLISSRSMAVERCVYSGMSKHIRMSQTASWFAHAGPGKYVLTPAGRAAEVWRGGGNQDWVAQTVPKKAVRLDLTWRQAATRVLREAGKPLHTTEILNRIWANGYKPRVDTAVPLRTLGNLLARWASDVGGKRNAPVQRVGPGTYSTA